MEFLDFIKQRWNIVLGISLAIVTVIAEFVVRPQISYSFPVGQVNYDSLAKFVVAGCILILLVPCSIYKGKKYIWHWWVLAIVTFVTAIVLFFYYNKAVNRVTAYNEYAGERFIIGETLTSKAQEAVNVAKEREGIELSASDMLETLGRPRDIWRADELESNSRYVIALYLTTLVSFAIFVLFSIQAVYCTTLKEREPAYA